MPLTPAPITTSTDSPDTLPKVGYNEDQLAEYILRQLGKGIWVVELTKQQILDNINDALVMWSMYVPRRKYFALRMTGNQFAYLQGQDCGQGVVDVQFVNPLPTPTAAFYANLITPVSTSILFQTGLDDYDSFLRWRTTWMRVTSTEPDWLWDESVGVLYIHNPIQNYQCAVLCYFSYDQTAQLPPIGAQWVKNYSLEKSRYQYGEILAKFNGIIPGPIKDIQLDTQKRSNADARLQKMEETLKGMQTGGGIFLG